MTKVEKNRANGKAEAVMMGMTQCVDSNEEAIYIIDYICKTLEKSEKGQDIFDKATRYSKGAKIKAVNICTLMEEFLVLTLPMETDEDEEPFDLMSDDGCFSYVYNFDCPDFSELGYCFFKLTSHGINRIA